MKYLLFYLFPICQFCYGQNDTATKIKLLADRELKYEGEGDVDRALKTSQEISDLDTTDYVVACSIAGLYGKQGDFDNEVVWAKKAIGINAAFSNSFINLGNGFAGLNELDKALGSFKLAGLLDVKSPYPPYSMGVIADMQGDYTNAIIFYQESVDRDPTFENGYYNLAADYANIRDFSSADKNILKVLKLNPDDKQAQAMHEHIIEGSQQH